MKQFGHYLFLFIFLGLLLNNKINAESKTIIKKYKENQLEKCEQNIKAKIKRSRIYCIAEKDILELGDYKSIKNLPDGMLKEIGKACKNESCIYKKAGKKVYEIFVRKGPIYHNRFPGEMVKGMAWFELMYHGKLKKIQKRIEKYNTYSEEKKRKHNRATKEIFSLIKMNTGRKSMREAMGLTLDYDVEEVIARHWLLGEMLNKDTLKVKKVKINPEIIKRKKLLNNYQATLKKYKKKLEEEKEKKGL